MTVDQTNAEFLSNIKGKTVVGVVCQHGSILISFQSNQSKMGGIATIEFTSVVDFGGNDEFAAEHHVEVGQVETPRIEAS